MLTYGSVCSGIECFGVAVRGLNFVAKWLSETDSYCCKILERQYPGVINHGDISKADLSRFDTVNVIVGGTPCQSFSVQGRRGGVDDERGKLAMRFGEIVAHGKPSWVVWENVPGVLTANDGRDFGMFLASLGECGYSLAYRVLDAKHFGVAQRRRRVYVVGHRGRWQCAAAALFDYRADNQTVGSRKEVSGRRRISLFDSVQGRVGITGDETPKHGIECTPTLRSQQGGEGVVVSDGSGKLRKATIREWERLQGLPDDYTNVNGVSESQRRKAIGNGFAVPVLRWIAERILFVEEIAYGM